MITEAIILAGGFGTRLQKVVQNVPKPMAPINGRPFLEYQINYLKSFGINRIILSVGYLSEIIEAHFQTSFNNIEIVYAKETTPLGTGGGIMNAFSKLKTQQAIVVNGDTIFEIDIKAFYLQHIQNNSLFSLALRKINDVSRYGSVIINTENIIQSFEEKGSAKGNGYINGGVYLIHKYFFEEIYLPSKFSMEKDVFEHYCHKFNFYGFPFEDYFLDIGIPEDFNKAQNEFKNLSY